MAIQSQQPDYGRLRVKLAIAADTVMTWKQFIVAGLTTAFKLFVNKESANAGARLALTGIASDYLVYQTDTKAFWQFTGTVPATAGHWTKIAQEVADETARLALTGIAIGFIAKQTDTGVYWRFYGTTPATAGDWQVVTGVYPPHMSETLAGLSGVVEAGTLEVASGGSLYLMSRLFAPSNDSLPAAAIVTTYGDEITDALIEEFLEFETDKLLLYSLAGTTVTLDVRYKL